MLLHISDGPHLLRVDLVDLDEGDARYAHINSSSTADAVGNGVPGSTVPATAPTDGAASPATAENTSGIPGVVAISRVDPHSGISAIATGDFDVRIVLTEEPAEFHHSQTGLMVRKGEASNLRKLLPVRPGMGGGLDASDFPGLRYNQTTTPVYW